MRLFAVCISEVYHSRMLQLMILLSVVLTLILGNFASAFSAETSVSNIKHITADNDDVKSKTKRIAIVGAGAVGSYYGG